MKAEVMSLSTTYSRIQPGIVAFVPETYKQLKSDSQPQEFIFGTGFVVGDSLVATNRHVVNVFDQFADRSSGASNVSIMTFLPADGGILLKRFAVIDAAFIRACVIEGYGEIAAPDLAIVAVKCKGLSKYAFSLSTAPVYAGDAIATSGFPMGPALLYIEGLMEQVSPTLQSGVISAVLPYQHEEVEPCGYVGNIMVQEGASGSPVFVPGSGEVIGVIQSRRFQNRPLQLPFPEPIPVQIPTNFSYVVPTHYLKQLIDQDGEELSKSVPDDAPLLDDVTRDVQKRYTTDVTRGVLRNRPKMPGE
jgi:hypothetical protein